MPFGIKVEWYANLSDTQQALTALATLLGVLVVAGLILVSAARRTNPVLAVTAAIVVLIFGYRLTAEALPDIKWAHDFLLSFILGCAITFGMQWQKRR